MQRLLTLYLYMYEALKLTMLKWTMKESSLQKNDSYKYKMNDGV